MIVDLIVLAAMSIAVQTSPNLWAGMRHGTRTYILCRKCVQTQDGRPYVATTNCTEVNGDCIDHQIDAGRDRSLGQE